MAKRTVKYESAKGTREAIFSLEYSVLPPQEDCEGFMTKPIANEHRLITVVAGDLVITMENLADAKNYQGKLPEGSTVYSMYATCNGKTMAFATSGLPYSAVEETWEALKAEARLESPDADEILSGKEIRLRAYDLSVAEEVVAIPPSRVFATYAAEKAWRKRFNDINNEGGDGYIPRTTTRAEFERAEKLIAEAAS
jgi:hypothetical protein